MKTTTRLFALLAALLMTAGLAGCGGTKTNSGNGTADSGSSDATGGTLESGATGGETGQTGGEIVTDAQGNPQTDADGKPKTQPNKPGGSTTTKKNGNAGPATTTKKDTPGVNTTSPLGSEDDGLPELKKPNVGGGSIKLACVNDTGEIARCNKLIAGFKKEYPNIEVTLEKISGEYDQKIITQSASGQIADVITIMDYMLNPYIDNKVLAPLDALYSDYGLQEKYYIQSVMDICKGGNNKLYMVPREYSQQVVAVNKTILASAKIDMPRDTWTYNDFLQICQKVTKKNASGKVTQFGLSGSHSDPNVWTMFMLGNNGQLTSGGKLTLSNSNSIKGMEALMGLVTDGYSVNDYDQSQTAAGFLAGQAAFAVTSRPGLEAINTSLSRLRMEWDVLPMFSMPGKRIVSFGTVGYGVTEKSSKKALGQAFVNYVMSVSGQTELYKTGTVVPVIKALQAKGDWKSLPVPGKNSDAFIYKPEDNNTQTIHKLLSTAKYLKLKEEMQKYQLKIIAKEITVADAMKALDQIVNDTK